MVARSDTSSESERTRLSVPDAGYRTGQRSLEVGTEMVERDEVDQHAGAVHRRDAGNLARLIVAAVIVAALAIVGMDNRDHVRLGYGIGHVSAPIWTVIVAAGLAGVVIGWLIRHRPRQRM